MCLRGWEMRACGGVSRVSSANDMLSEDQAAKKEWWAPGEPLGLTRREDVAGIWLGLCQRTAGWSFG